MKSRKAEKGVIILNQEALQYGEKACAAMMKHYRNSADIPPKGGFHYHAGVFLSGMMEMYRVNGNEEYFDYVKNWVDNIVTAPGIIRFYMKGSLDDYMAGILLFPLFERTQDKRYSETLDMLMANIRNWAKNEYGGFWHKEWRPNQMWLDGLYMAGPLQALYGRATGKTYFSDEAVRQAVLMYEHMQDKKTKLLYHAWDASKEIEWCDKQTGLAPEFWGRAMGWYVVAILNIMECLEKTSENYQKLEHIEREVLTAVLSFQNPKDKLWYQVLDKADRGDNWAEASCSCLFVYALAKAVRMGVLDSDCLEAARSGFEAILKSFTSRDEEGDFVLNKVCIGTGVMDYEGYINRPTSENDLHGMGAFLLMCSEMAKL